MRKQMRVLYSHSRMIPRFITVSIILVIITVSIIIIIITRPKLARPSGRLTSRLRRSAHCGYENSRVIITKNQLGTVKDHEN